MSNSNYTSANAIMIGKRFYYRHDRRRVFTAWSLAGAKLFQTFEVLEVVDKLRRRGKQPYVVRVEVQS